MEPREEKEEDEGDDEGGEDYGQDTKYGAEAIVGGGEGRRRPAIGRTFGRRSLQERPLTGPHCRWSFRRSKLRVDS